MNLANRVIGVRTEQKATHATFLELASTRNKVGATLATAECMHMNRCVRRVSGVTFVSTVSSTSVETHQPHKYLVVVNRVIVTFVVKTSHRLFHPVILQYRLPEIS